jgi:hypothetical protein
MQALGRPTHKRNLQELIEEYRRTLPHGSSFELREFAVWAIRERRWAPTIKSAADLLVSEAGAALREEYFTDDQGRRVRKKHVVRVRSEDEFGNRKQLTLWNDITTAPPEHMLASLQQRRMGIADDCWQLKQDLDSYNDNWNPGERIQIWFDFTEDMEERELSAHYPSAYFDEDESAEKTEE